MLRALVLILVLINALFFGWTRGWLDTLVGLPAHGDREPERMLRQLHPDRIQLLGPQVAAALQQRACLEIGPIKGEEAWLAAQAQLAKAGAAATDWQDLKTEQAGVWAVASIKFPNKEFQQRKEETYKRMNIAYEYLSGPPEEMPSMLLSRHASEQAAEAALAALNQRALKGLRVMNLQPAQSLHTLKFAQADGALRARLKGLFKDLAPLRECSSATVAAAPASAATSAPTATASAASR